MRYISILRGINVSGQKKIKMADLKSLYESLGFQNVVTYIQSGNVIFDANVQIKSDIKARIEKAIDTKYKFHVPVEIRTNHEIGDIIKNHPFGSVDLAEDGAKVLVTFLSSEPSEIKISDIQKYVTPPEQLVVREKEVYLYCPNGYGKSKLSNTFLESRLGVEATTRNMKTVHKLYELSVR
jgi:uncharacterized protein (DUF1697 family)